MGRKFRALIDPSVLIKENSEVTPTHGIDFSFSSQIIIRGRHGKYAAYLPDKVIINELDFGSLII